MPDGTLYAVYWRGDAQTSWTLEKVVTSSREDAEALASSVKGARRFRFTADHTTVIEYPAPERALALVLVGQEKKAVELSHSLFAAQLRPIPRDVQAATGKKAKGTKTSAA